MNYQRGYLLVILILFSFFLLLVFKNGFQKILYFFDDVINLVASSFYKIGSGISSIYSSWKTKNTELALLKKENVLLKEKLVLYEELQRRTLRLEKLLSLKESLPCSSIAAEVIAVSGNNYFLTITVNKGEKHGITKNYIVVTPEGIVGRVIETASLSSKVLLITDPRSAVAGLISKNRTRAVIQGTGKNLCKVIVEDPFAQVEEGDIVITSGLGGIFPKGLVVGKITKVERNRGTGEINVAYLKPAVDLFRLEEVLIYEPCFEIN